MIETQNKAINLDELNDQVKKEISAKEKKTYKKEYLEVNLIVEDSIIKNLINISSNWQIAEQYSDIANRQLHMDRFPKPIRWLAKLSGRVVLYLNKVITSSQTIYNQNVLIGLRASTESLENLQSQIGRLNDTNSFLHDRLTQLENVNSYQQNRLNQQENLLESLLNNRNASHHIEKESASHQHKFNQEAQHLFDPLYSSFEDQFRGSRQAINDRLSIYLKYIDEANAGADERPILDAGCGRGEWLEILKENEFASKGVDLNRIFIEQCIKHDLEVVEDDAVHHLQGLSSNSLGAMTAFHLIEHLPFEVLIKFFDETLRILKSGGIAIFETPNPQNLLVGACNFWTDPTHLKPLYPETQKFLMEYRGFVNVKLMFVNPHEEGQTLPESEAPKLAKRLNDLFYCARDYAVIGYKA